MIWRSGCETDETERRRLRGLNSRSAEKIGRWCIHDEWRVCRCGCLWVSETKGRPWQIVVSVVFPGSCSLLGVPKGWMISEHMRDVNMPSQCRLLAVWLYVDGAGYVP